MWKKYWKICTAAVFLTVAGICYGCSESRQETVLLKEGQEPAGELFSDREAAGETAAGQDLRALEHAAGPGGNRQESGVPDVSEQGLDPQAGGAQAADGQETGPPFSGKQPSGGNVLGADGSEPGIFIHICGEVNAPGVYELPKGSRVFEAVEAAGGFTGEAEEELLNLAEKLADGMKIVVLSEKEAESLTAEERNSLFTAQGNSGPDAESGSFKESGPININTASKEELMTLSGVGQSKAEDIIRYREENGGFKTIEEIMKVPGIKNAGFQKIKNRITV